MYISFEQKENIMKTEFKKALSDFLDKNDIECIIDDFISNIKYARAEKEINISNDTDLLLLYYSNLSCCNIEVWIRNYDSEGNITDKEMIVLYDTMNDTWDSIMSTEQYTESELMDLKAEKYNEIAHQTMISDISDIICFSVD